jgi:hypothetical protein
MVFPTQFLDTGLLDHGDIIVVGSLAETSEKGRDSGTSDSGSERVKHGCKLKVRHCVGIIGVVPCQILAPETLSQGVIRLIFGTDG